MGCLRSNRSRDGTLSLVAICYSVNFAASQPFTSYFPRADILELLAPDILHQIIKGTFKDHLVLWVEILLKNLHGTAHGKRVMDDIDHR